MPTYRWVYKDEVHMYNGILLNHKKKWSNSFCRNMDGPRNDHTQWSKPGREKQMPYDIAYLWNLKYETNEFTNETDRLTDIETGLRLPRGGKSRWTGIWGLADANYYIWDGYKQQCPTVYHRELYSISCDKPYGKECEKECIYLYNWITLLFGRNEHNIVRHLYFKKTHF